MKFYINSDTQRSEHFTTSIGLPQGCCLSPTMFSLFAHDIGDCFSHQGLDLNGTKIKYLQYADDLVILCDNQYELQSQIDNLAKYCSENSLKLNEKKTKILVFICIPANAELRRGIDKVEVSRRTTTTMISCTDDD